jgi:hypothetical protein
VARSLTRKASSSIMGTPIPIPTPRPALVPELRPVSLAGAKEAVEAPDVDADELEGELGVADGDGEVADALVMLK